mmetsp:Transcript_41136/g.124274  ORF Transcript_41136/g.124274 Transcript_41136/m.124274 type:complete len:200 (-) Transcript_41136:2487-3086(-)
MATRPCLRSGRMTNFVFHLVHTHSLPLQPGVTTRRFLRERAFLLIKYSRTVSFQWNLREGGMTESWSFIKKVVTSMLKLPVEIYLIVARQKYLTHRPEKNVSPTNVRRKRKTAVLAVAIIAAMSTAAIGTTKSAFLLDPVGWESFLLWMPTHIMFLNLCGIYTYTRLGLPFFCSKKRRRMIDARKKLKRKKPRRKKMQR